MIIDISSKGSCRRLLKLLGLTDSTARPDDQLKIRISAGELALLYPAQFAEDDDLDELPPHLADEPCTCDIDGPADMLYKVDAQGLHNLLKQAAVLAKNGETDDAAADEVMRTIDLSAIERGIDE